MVYVYVGGYGFDMIIIVYEKTMIRESHNNKLLL
jgi:hypothetical protein